MFQNQFDEAIELIKQLKINEQERITEHEKSY